MFIELEPKCDGNKKSYIQISKIEHVTHIGSSARVYFSGRSDFVDYKESYSQVKELIDEAIQNKDK